MDYECSECEKTGKLKISVRGELLELSLCARIILDITEGSESAYLKSKLHIDNLSKIVKADTAGIGNSKQEQFSYSKNGLEYSFLPDGHPKSVVDAAKNHYMIIKRELDGLTKFHKDRSGIFGKRPRDIDYYG